MAIVDSPEVAEPEKESLVADYPKVVPMSASRPLTDQENADSIRSKLTESSKELLQVFDLARSLGLAVSWTSISIGPNGKHQITGLDIARHF